MASSPSTQTALQEDLLREFFAREQRFFLTGGAGPATIAWVLEQLGIGPDAPLPGQGSLELLDSFRRQLIDRLRQAAFGKTQQ